MNKNKVLALATITTGLSYSSYRYISKQMEKRIFNINADQQIVDTKYLEWLSACQVSQVKTDSFDGLKLSALNIHNYEGAPYLIMVHGLWTDKSRLYSRAYEFDARGYNILLIDQRGAGDSQGQYCTYGGKESQDLLIWISYLVNKIPDVKICLYGLSMGAATVMMSCAYHLDEHVKCIIEESGYATLKDEFDHFIKSQSSLVYTYPVLKMVERKLKELTGMCYEDIQPKKCLENNEVPILFAHGDNDETVPFVNAKILYNHNKGVKKYYPISGGGHSNGDTFPHYFDHLTGFIETYMD